MSISSESGAESAMQANKEPAPVKGPPKNIVTGVIKAVRPRQWVKNLLVLIAPVAAFGRDIQFDYHQVAIKALIAFVAFSLAASSVYLVNDVRDVEADRQHPTKRFRPIAAGVVPVWLAYALAVVLGIAALAVHRWHRGISSSSSPSTSPCRWPTASGSNIRPCSTSALCLRRI